jgi:hypothetical protein
MIGALQAIPSIFYAICVPCVVAAIFGGALLFSRSRNWIENQFFNWIPGFDYVMGAVLTALVYFFLQYGGLMPCSLDFLKEEGTAAYGALLSAFAALLGFAVTVLAIVCTVIPSLRLVQYVTKEQYEQFWKTFTLIIRTLGACTLATLIAVFLNKSEHAREGLFFLVVLIIGVTIPGLLRSAMTLEVLVKAIGAAPFAKVNRPPNPSVEP